MTDITDQDRRTAHEWAASIGPEMDCLSASTRAVARVILATVGAPAPTLAEELRGQAEWARRIGAPCNAEKIDSLAARAEQMERDLEEARAAQMEHDIEELRAEATALAEDLAGAESEVERLTTERDRLQAQVQGLVRRDGDHNSEVRMLTEERDEARAEVERLTAVQKGAESNAESIDPADVKPGEPWLIRVRGRDAVAIRDGHEEWPWSVAFIHGESDEAKDDVVTLVSRLVPTPRVITNPDELERLAATSIIRDGRGWPGGVTDQGVIMINGFCLSDEDVLSRGPVTVLWEPGA